MVDGKETRMPRAKKTDNQLPEAEFQAAIEQADAERNAATETKQAEADQAWLDQGIEAVDMSAQQAELQRIFALVRDRTDTALHGKMITAKNGRTSVELVRPTGKIVTRIGGLGLATTKDQIRHSQGYRGVYHYAGRYDIEGDTNVSSIEISAYEVYNANSDQLVATLVHEYCHLVADATNQARLLVEKKDGVKKPKGFRDTSRQGRYHNRIFADLATATGLLTVSPNDSIGYVTEPNEALRIWCKEEVAPNFDAYIALRREIDEEEKAPKPKTTAKLQCPECGHSAVVKIKDLEATRDDDGKLIMPLRLACMHPIDGADDGDPVEMVRMP